MSRYEVRQWRQAVADARRGVRVVFVCPRLGAATLAALVMLLTGCGASHDRDVNTARKALELTSEAGASADEIVAYECYRAPTPRAVAKAPECSAATDALVTTRRSLLTAQEAVDAWDAGGSGQGAVRVLACIAGALGRAQEAMRAAGLSVPDKLSEALGVASTFGRAQCGEGE